MSKRVLVVEDNELNLKLFCDLLKAHDYATEPVRDGREAVERARAFAPDLIVMDIQLPYVSGLELIETCKADAELRAIPIMAVTAYAGKEDEERVRAAGAEAYVSKPISLMRFIGEVVALTPKEARPAPEAVEEPLPEDEPTAAVFPEDLFPEDRPETPAADIAEAEDPLPEDQPGDGETAPDEGEGGEQLALPPDEPVTEADDDDGEAVAVPDEEVPPPAEEPPAEEAGDEKPI